MSYRKHVRAALLLGLALFLLVETLSWWRGATVSLVHQVYPRVGLDAEGEVVYYDLERERDNGTFTTRVTVLDADRNPVREWSSRDAAAGKNPTKELLPHAFSRWGVRTPDFDDARFLRDHLPTARLDSLEGIALGLNEVEQVLAGTHDPLPYSWSVEERRLVCREASTGKVLAGFGPDGYRKGPDAARGQGFGRQVKPWPLAHKYFDNYGPRAWGWATFDRDSMELIALAVPLAATTPFVGPVVVDVRRGIEVPEGADDGRRHVAYLGAFDDEMLLLSRKGELLARWEREQGEFLLSVEGAEIFTSFRGAITYQPAPLADSVRVGIATAMGPVHPAGNRLRLRRLERRGPMVTRDVELRPARGIETFLANFGAAFALLRPLPLNAASSLSGLPQDWSEVYAWWWRDPWLAGGHAFGWLLLSLALALWCGWRARTWARMRCANEAAVRFWIASAFLLGPLGLLWMRLVLPRVPVEEVDGGRRAVNLDASPSTQAPWPEPAPLGIEVLGEGI